MISLFMSHRVSFCNSINSIPGCRLCFFILAACQCIAELASKISPDILAPHVNDLLSTLIETFHDDSWPVRDMACVACGTFISHYPGESSEKFSILKELFVENLKDPIASVRQGAAQAIGKSVKAYYQQDNQQQVRREI